MHLIRVRRDGEKAVQDSASNTRSTKTESEREREEPEVGGEGDQAAQGAEHF